MTHPTLLVPLAFACVALTSIGAETNPNGTVILRPLGIKTGFQRLNLMVGSYDMRRSKLDISRRLNEKFAIRLNLADQDANGFVNHTKRGFKGGQLAFTYRPFKNTEVVASIERTSTRATRADGILAERFERFRTR